MKGEGGEGEPETRTKTPGDELQSEGQNVAVEMKL